MPVWSRITAEAQRQLIALLLDRGPLSRADLARLTDLNKPTISNLVAQLLDEGIVQEIGAGESTGGRKPILLAMRERCRFALGVELDSTRCRVMLTDLAGTIVDQRDAAIASSDPETVVDAIAGAIDALLISRDRASLLGCGVAVPGLVDPENDTVSGDSRLGWQRVPLQALLEARLNLPVLVTDRGKAAGLGEMWVLGKERSHDLIYLYLGTGVAGAVVLGRDVHWGVSNLAGEIGHMTVDPNGPRCSCGNRGCLEALVSTRAILEGLPAGQTIAEIGVAAEQGDLAALERVTRTARWLAIAISNLINTLNPAVIVLGGPTASWGTVLTGAIDREIETRALPQSRRAARVVIGQAREQAAPLGAAVLVLRQAAELITEPNLASRAIRA